MAKMMIDKLAPDFSVADYTGKPVSLSDFRGVANVLLVFNRGFT
jgi:peroxiredoxin